MKIRAGGNKAKPKIQQDFKRKTAKVGKKVARSNVTEIKIASKRISLALQSNITARAPGDEREVLQKLLKQLHHYSASSRVVALEELRALAASSNNSESYISLIVPQAMELLFDDDYAARKALIALLQVLLLRFKSASFTSIASIAITYICSGLTSLNKGVVRDALSLLHCLADHHRTLLSPYIEKLLTHILALLASAAQTQYTRQSNGVLTIGKLSAQAATSVQGPSTAASGSSSEGAGQGGRAERDLLRFLRVISALYAAPIAAAATQIQDAQNTISVVLLRPRYRKCAMLEPAYSARNSYHDPNPRKQTLHDGFSAGTAGLREASACSSSTLSSLCQQLHELWVGLALDSSSIRAAAVSPLREIARIALCLSNPHMDTQGPGHGNEPNTSQNTISNPVFTNPAYRQLVVAMFATFPHFSLEAATAVVGSHAEKQLQDGIRALDIALCQVIITCIPVLGGGCATGEGSHAQLTRDQSDKGDSEGICDLRVALGKARKYVMGRLDEHIETLEKEEDDGMDVDADSALNGSDDEDGMSGSESRASGEETGGDEDDLNNNSSDSLSPTDKPNSHTSAPTVAEEASRLIGPIDQADLLARLYNSLGTMALSNENMYHSAALAAAEDSSIITSVLSLLVRLVESAKRVTDALSIGSSPRQTLLKVVRPGLLCLSGIASDPLLWSNMHILGSSHGNGNGIRDLILALTQALGLVGGHGSRWPNEPGGPMSRALLEALLTVLRKIGDWEVESLEGVDAKHGQDLSPAAFSDRSSRISSSLRANLAECILSLFADKIAFAVVSTNSSPKPAHSCRPSRLSVSPTSRSQPPTPKRTAQSFFARCPHFQRLMLLDIFFYTPFSSEMLLDAARAVLANFRPTLMGVQAAWPPGNASNGQTLYQCDDEVQYFLRLFYERRGETSLSDFMQVLVEALDGVETRTGLGLSRRSLSAPLTPSAASTPTLISSLSTSLQARLQRVQHISSAHWAVHDIAAVLLRCSSAETPTRILSILPSLLQDLIEDSLKVSLNKDSGDQESLISDWLGSHVSAVAVLVVIEKLVGGTGEAPDNDLASHAANGTGTSLSDPENAIVTSTYTLAARIVCRMLINIGSLSTGSWCGVVTKSAQVRLLHAALRLVTQPTRTASSTSLSVQHSSPLMLQAVLQHMLASLISAKEAKEAGINLEAESVTSGLLLLIEQPQCLGLIGADECRSLLSAVVVEMETLCKGAKASERLSALTRDLSQYCLHQ